ncbi:hypothetical protein A9Q84_21170 [Halobacteriovorax marinus]|uniref:RDD domain-containing protein n=1 Tax=Halobacteriovorax marinus TaxID=97084 RepID=A0A1Y5F1L7_9BACT|nr:hypothetical protein A9Q84_21170 [Halobacteriovorax marinus]
MENQTPSTNDQAVDAKIAFSAAEFNLDDFDFKPLNEGLGFHHDDRKNGILPQSNTKPQNISVTRNVMPTLSKSLGVSDPKVVKNGMESMNSLSAFYSEGQLETTSESESELNLSEQAVETYELAKPLLQLTAWLIDVLVVLTISSSLLGLFVLVSGLNFSQFYQFVGMNDLVLFGAVSFSIFYLSYFSILDLQSTPGKSFFKLRLVREDHSDLILKDSFMRAFITLISFVTLGLPCLIDFQGKLTDTKVVINV